MNLQILLCLATLAIVCEEGLGAKWHYHHGPLGPENWHTIKGSHCGGRKQSPINIVTYETVPVDMGDFVFDGLQTTVRDVGWSAPGGGAGPRGGGGNGGGNGVGGGGGGGWGSSAGNNNGWYNNGWGTGGYGNNAWNGWYQAWQDTWNQVSGNTNQHWSNPFGNLRMPGNNNAPPTKSSLFGAGGADYLTTSDNGIGPSPRAMHGFNRAPTRKVEVSNNGHTLTVGLENFYMLHGGGLPFNAKPEQLHFHWGTTHDRGSEHTINHQAFAAELHLVHYNEKYANIGEAIKQPDGLAVLGFFIMASENYENPAFDPLLDITENVKFKGTKVEYYAHLPLREMLPESLNCFYRYNGSLTTPNCYESVTWTMFCDPIYMSHNQLDMFRELYQGFFIEPNGQLEMLHIEDNFRPVQALHGRQVLRSGIPNFSQPGSNNDPRFRFSQNSSGAMSPAKFLLALSAVMALICRSL